MGHGGHANQGAAAVYTPRGRQKGFPGGGGGRGRGVPRHNQHRLHARTLHAHIAMALEIMEAGSDGQTGLWQYDHREHCKAMYNSVVFCSSS